MKQFSPGNTLLRWYKYNLHTGKKKFSKHRWWRSHTEIYKELSNSTEKNAVRKWGKRHEEIFH